MPSNDILTVKELADFLKIAEKTAYRFASEGKVPGFMKWSGKFGQRAKMYPTRTNGYENDKATELFRQV